MSPHLKSSRKRGRAHLLRLDPVEQDDSHQHMNCLVGLQTPPHLAGEMWPLCHWGGAGEAAVPIAIGELEEAGRAAQEVL